MVGQIDRAGVLYATAPAVLHAITDLANSRNGLELRDLSEADAAEYVKSASRISKLPTEGYNRTLPLR